jgi:hypothetical protein
MAAASPVWGLRTVPQDCSSYIAPDLWAPLVLQYVVASSNSNLIVCRMEVCRTSDKQPTASRCIGLRSVMLSHGRTYGSVIAPSRPQFLALPSPKRLLYRTSVSVTSQLIFCWKYASAKERNSDVPCLASCDSYHNAHMKKLEIMSTLALFLTLSRKAGTDLQGSACAASLLVGLGSGSRSPPTPLTKIAPSVIGPIFSLMQSMGRSSICCDEAAKFVVM